MTDQKTYQLFDTNEPQKELHLRLTSNKNIQQVVDVLCSFKHADFDERLYYAKQAGDIPVERDENGDPVKDENDNVIVEFENKYLTTNTYWAGLAQALFVGCPKLVTFDDEGVAQLNEENQNLNNALIREIIHGGLEDFLGKFGLKLYEQNDLFSLFQTDLNPNGNLINQVVDILQNKPEALEIDEENIKTPLKAGKTK